MSQQGSLLDMISEKRMNIELVKDASQVDDSKPNVKMVGANWCAYSKIDVSQLNDACEDVKKGKCYIFDTTIPESADAAKKLGLEVEGFPTHFLNDGKGKQQLLVGMRPQKVLKEALKSTGFKFS